MSRTNENCFEGGEGDIGDIPSQKLWIVIPFPEN